MLYASYEDNFLKNKAIEESKREAEIKQKIDSGKLRGYYKPGMSNKLKDKLIGKK